MFSVVNTLGNSWEAKKGSCKQRTLGKLCGRVNRPTSRVKCILTKCTLSIAFLLVLSLVCCLLVL
uniref:Uncharacterized protein n=1 Tax=Anguilla anguilla TaxID=7936 RepID=A0A0E9S263_ANGAN